MSLRALIKAAHDLAEEALYGANRAYQAFLMLSEATVKLNGSQLGPATEFDFNADPIALPRGATRFLLVSCFSLQAFDGASPAPGDLMGAQLQVQSGGPIVSFGPVWNAGASPGPAISAGALAWIHTPSGPGPFTYGVDFANESGDQVQLNVAACALLIVPLP